MNDDVIEEKDNEFSLEDLIEELSGEMGLLPLTAPAIDVLTAIAHNMDVHDTDQMELAFTEQKFGEAVEFLVTRINAEDRYSDGDTH